MRRGTSKAGVNPAALITGGSRGIGRGIAQELARLGWNLLINFVSNQAAAQAAAAACMRSARIAGRRITVDLCRADISRAEDRERLLRRARKTFRRLDMLVNNAGVAPEVRTDILNGTEESFDRLMAINVKGPYFLTQAAARWMVEQGTPPAGQPSRKIVTVTSVSAYAASINRGDYCVAKAALSMLTPLFASRLAEHGINVYEIRPGVIATDMTLGVKAHYDDLIARGLTPIQRWGTPGDVGKAVSAIAQDLLPFSTGEVINVDGGFHVRRL